MPKYTGSTQHELSIHDTHEAIEVSINHEFTDGAARMLKTQWI